MDINSWFDTWATLHYVRDPEDKIIQRITEFYRAGVDFNMRNDFDMLKETPLISAAPYASEKVIDFLIGGGADINLRDGNDKTALIYAVAIKQAKNIKCLIKHGPRDFVNKTDWKGKSALYWAAEKSQTEAIKVLLENGANVNIQSMTNETPLHRVVWNQSEETPNSIKVLIEHGANVNIQDKDGSTPLHYAVVWGRVDTVKLLIEGGADVSIQDSNGKTPLDLAVREEKKEFISNADKIRAKYLASHLRNKMLLINGQKTR